MNIIKCKKCNMSLIQEEVEIHQCYIKIPSKFWGDTDNDYYEIFDGKNWIPMKLQQPKSNTEKTTDNETEPNLRL